MLLIATDEAGYGPKLGPLVIAATAWHVPDDIDLHELENLFLPLREEVEIDGGTVVVDDSKAVFQAGKKNPLRKLHALVSAGNFWSGIAAKDVDELIERTAPVVDVESVRRAVWLGQADVEPDFLSEEVVQDAIALWARNRVRLTDVSTRVITARAFNEFCAGDRNKSDLLSLVTLGLVKELLHRHGGNHKAAEVYCDRHGGRRYYAGPLQHVFDESFIQLGKEARDCSDYRFEYRGVPVAIRFTVKGDRFAPVGFSSLYAKYLRERMMGRFNAYFRQHSKREYQDTAGYPVDADRFLTEQAELIKALQIDRHQFVRNR